MKRKTAWRLGVSGAALMVATTLTATAWAQTATSDSTAMAKEFAYEKALMSAKPIGPADKPWLQSLSSATVDTAKYKKAPPYRVCFSNASVSNPWRVVGWKVMQAEAELHKSEIASLSYADAQDKDDKQISDIRAFVTGGKCDVLIVSPHTSDALTPVVEEACKVLPVITFDRSVNTTCPVTAVRTIGGYAYGIAGATYVVDHMPKGGKLLELRTAPGIDVFETRDDAAAKIFTDAGIKPIGVEYTGADNAKTKAVVSDYLSRFGKIDAVWVDFGAMSVAVAEAFEDAGQDYPIITGEDQEDYLQKWKQEGFKGIAPTYPAYQWRTALIAALDVLQGKPVYGPNWILPQPIITSANLDQYVNAKMPPLHYAACGCEGMPGYPERWGGKP
ncbi:ABC transporter substrate-binding protein [Acidisoma cellulosilytica]|uniref:ABC transporter substrate-binding protein n=1 Tax=Acidisoma cellulosilyticum TaxID=2802395 RepID=A0A963Z423_9PROT|nr:ABC transporter substrate-binding protein [Acidisoma cellulosilyticum]MCB8881363.1 ABC transporter substrate-binding protein [Acidisoma cellulosilyticum]